MIPLGSFGLPTGRSLASQANVALETASAQSVHQAYDYDTLVFLKKSVIKTKSKKDKLGQCEKTKEPNTCFINGLSVKVFSHVDACRETVLNSSMPFHAPENPVSVCA